jgi:hypothetical protein
MTSRVHWLVLLFPLAVLGAACDLAAGGTTIELTTTNGAIRVQGERADQNPATGNPGRR